MALRLQFASPVGLAFLLLLQHHPASAALAPGPPAPPAGTSPSQPAASAAFLAAASSAVAASIYTPTPFAAEAAAGTAGSGPRRAPAVSPLSQPPQPSNNPGRSAGLSGEQLQQQDKQQQQQPVGAGKAVRVDVVPPPCLHTQPPAELLVQSWPASMRCPKEGVLEMYDIEDEYGALHRTVRHAPLPGVNSSHLEWWFSGGRPGRLLYGGRMWDAYKLWHAVDHVSFEWTQLPDPTASTDGRNSSTSGAISSSNGMVIALHIVERFRGPAANASSSTPSVRARAVAASTPTAVPYVSFPLDAELVVNNTQRNMHRLLYYVGSVPMQELSHTWEDGPQGLLLTSVMVLGGRTRRSAAFNTVLRSRVFPPVQLAAWTLHCLEEFGNMPYFLPYVYDRAASRAESSSVVLVQG